MAYPSRNITKEFHVRGFLRRALRAGLPSVETVKSLIQAPSGYQLVDCVKVGCERDPYTRAFRRRVKRVMGQRLEAVRLPGSRPKGKAAVKAFKRAKQRQTEQGQRKSEVRRWMRKLVRYRGKTLDMRIDASQRLINKSHLIPGSVASTLVCAGGGGGE